MWFIDQFEKGTLYEAAPIYHNLPLLLRLDWHPDPELFTGSMALLVSRYPILATRLVSHDNKPYQEVAEPPPPLRPEVYAREDLQTPGEVLAFAKQLISRPFDLATGPLFRLQLIYGRTGGMMVLVAHHCIADRFSMHLIASGLLEIYAGLSQGPAVADTPRYPSYAEYSKWQRSFSGELVEELVFNWRHRLASVQPLELPMAANRKPIHVYEAATAALAIPADLERHLRRFTGQTEVAVSTALMACFQVLLSKYSGSDQVVVGTFAPNRETDKFKSIVGPLANLLAINSTLPTTAPFATLCTNLAADLAHARENKELPFDQLVMELKLRKDMARTALFDVLFHYEHDLEMPGSYPLGERTLPVIETNAGLGKYDLNLLVKDGEGGLQLFLTYNCLYFGHQQMDDFCQHYLVLLEQLLTEADQVSSRRLLTQAQQQEMLRAGGNPDVAYPEAETIVSIFEAQAKATPANAAVRCGETTLDYAALDQLANQVADFLIREKSLRPEDYVVVCLEKSPVVIAVLLGILKAGGAYVPVDPAYPADRIDYIRRDSAASVFFDQALLEEFSRGQAGYSPYAPTVGVQPHHLAYVIYTSGSTGRPKGVQVEHKNVVRLLKNDAFPFDFGAKDVWTLFHSLCFDFSVWEMYGALLYGGCLLVVDRDTAKDAAAFRTLLLERNVTVLNLTPTAFENISRALQPEDVLALRYVIFGGEQLQPAILKTFHGNYPAVKLINMYGITETTVHVTCKELTAADIGAPGSNIGVPIPTLGCYVLDAQMNLLPYLVAGELYVAGAGLARGYLNQEALTAERFVGNPFGNGRLYKSGDKGRWLPSGELEYLGRLDEQVKVRGFRIEAGEIESALLSAAFIEQAKIVVNKKSAELHAYVVAREAVSLGELRALLAEKLPDHMIPARFFCVKQFPLTVNGKLDQAALLSQDKTELLSDEHYVAPTSETEATLVNIWREVLEKERVGTRDDFFKLGGHSIKGMKVLMKIQQQFGVSVEVRKLFEYPTIHHLAKEINLKIWVNKSQNALNDEPDSIII